MFFGQVASSSLGSVIILYVILTVTIPFHSIFKSLNWNLIGMHVFHAIFFPHTYSCITYPFMVYSLVCYFKYSPLVCWEISLNWPYVFALSKSFNWLYQYFYQNINFSGWIFNFISFKIQHDKVYEAALLLNFHELPMNERRLYRFFVKSCQKPALLTIGGLAPLNLATCVTVCDWYFFRILMGCEKIHEKNIQMREFCFIICRFFHGFIRLQWWFLLWLFSKIADLCAARRIKISQY